jgi:hypothetical protein
MNGDTQGLGLLCGGGDPDVALSAFCVKEALACVYDLVRVGQSSLTNVTTRKSLETKTPISGWLAQGQHAKEMQGA